MYTPVHIEERSDTIRNENVHTVHKTQKIQFIKVGANLTVPSTVKFDQILSGKFVKVRKHVLTSICYHPTLRLQSDKH